MGWPLLQQQLSSRVDAREKPTTERVVSWFRTWRKPLRQWLLHRASVRPGDVDELAQEVFLRLLRFKDDILVGNPQGYLFRIAANVANEWRERCRIRRPHEEQWLQDLQADAALEPESLVRQQQRKEYLQAAVDALPARQRDILLLHVNEGLTYKQIAQKRGFSRRLVMRELTRAYSKLRTTVKLEDL